LRGLKKHPSKPRSCGEIGKETTCGEKTITFPTLLISCAPYFFSKKPLRYSDFVIRAGVFICHRVKKKSCFTNSDFVIRKNPKISKNRARYMIFFGL